MRVRRALIVLVAAAIVIAANLPLAQVHAQGGNGISSPGDGAVVQGSVQIVGTATLPDFMRYDLHVSANEQDWIYFGSGSVPVVGGVLGYWDTVGMRIPDGLYTIRLRVVKTDSNYDEYFVRSVRVANSAPPTAAVTPTDIAQPDTPTPPPTSETGGTPSGTVVVTVEQPPTRAAATASPTRRAGVQVTSSSPLDAFTRVSLDGVRERFCSGATFTAGAFALIGAYVFVRNSTHWLARRLRQTLYRRSHRTRP